VITPPQMGTIKTWPTTLEEARLKLGYLGYY